ncbi:MAG: amidohydrolase [Chloroflexota bacterium]
MTIALTPEQHERLIATRRDFHQHPELAHQERRTASIVASRLRELGLDEVRTEVGQTGVLGVLRGIGPGKTVLLRADMDGLPLTEQDRGQPYRSTYEGAHHACGHDGHVAILLMVAEVLVGRRDTLAGQVSFAFQPAEERVDGARGMIAEGALDPRPDACFGLHLWNDLRAGHIDARSGPVYASADAFAISLTAAGGHAAMPHQTPDPIVAAAELIVGLQSLVSREVPPMEPAVLTIGSIHGGTAHNIIPNRVDLQGTLRVFDPAVRERLVERLMERVASLESTSGVGAEIKMTDTCPATINNGPMTELVRSVGARLLGRENVSQSVRTTGSEDMSLFLNAVPGCFFFVGSGNPERDLTSPHHSPTFDFDEAALEVGVNVLAQTTLEFLEGREHP